MVDVPFPLYHHLVILHGYLINIFRYEVFQTNAICMFLTLFCLLQATRATVLSAQVIVTLCHIDMFRSELF